MVLRQRPNLSVPPAVSLPYGDGRDAMSPMYHRNNKNSNTTPNIMSGHHHTFFNDKSSTSSYNKHEKSKLNTLNTICLVIILIIGYLIISSTSDISHRKEDIRVMKVEYDRVRSYIRDTEEELSQAQEKVVQLDRKVRMLEKKNSLLSSNLEEANKKSSLTSHELTELTQAEIQRMLGKRTNAMMDRINILQREIQDISTREAIERFGEGPHHFHVAVEYPSGEEASFLIETFPLSDMPHTIHYFLQTVVHKLWDNTIFLHTNDHVMQGAPVDKIGNDLRQRFRDAHLAHLAFPEYNPKYNHEKYTLGFGGRPGGPDFYISTQDNSHFHGPGGQGQHDIHEEADPCFAKVIEGFHVIDKMHQITLDAIEANGGQRITEDKDVRVTVIKYIEIVPTNQTLSLL